MIKKNKKICTVLNYIDHSHIVISIITGCVSISAFASLVVIPARIESSTIGLKICYNCKIKKYRSMITKKKKKQDKIILLTKSKLNSTEVLISKALIDSKIIHDEFVLTNNVLKEHYDTKEEIKIPITNKKSDYIYKRVLPYCLKCRKNKQSKNPEVVKTKNRRIMLLSTRSVGNSKKSKFLKEQEARGLLSSLVLTISLSHIPFLGPLSF